MDGRPEAKEKETSLIEAINQRMKKTIDKSGKSNSAKAYKTLIKNVNECPTKAEANHQYPTELKKWMISQGYAAGYIGKMIQTLKTVIKSINPETANKIEPANRKHSDKIYLTPAEICAIESVELGKSLDKARDLFLIGYYTGQRYSDWAKIKHENIVFVKKSQIVQFYAEKTGINTAVPVSEKLYKILQKHGGSPPMISNQKINKYLREVAKMAGISSKVRVKSYRYGQEIEESFEKWELVTTHTARRSFATNGIAAGIPMLDIMKLGGWKSVTSFSAYIRTTSVETAERYSEHGFFS